MKSGADPELSADRGVHQQYNYVKFCEIPHEIKKFLFIRGKNSKILRGLIIFSQEDINHPSREEWIKLCDVKVQTGSGSTVRSPSGRNRNDRERFDSKGNRIWPPVDKSKSGEEVFAADRLPPNYRRADSVYPGLQEDMDGTEVFVHDFH